jgi:hypothetical protein
MYRFIVIRFHSLVRPKKNKKKKNNFLGGHQADLLSPNLVCMLAIYFFLRVFFFNRARKETRGGRGEGVYSEWAQFYEPRKSSSCRVAEKSPKKQIFSKHV